MRDTAYFSIYSRHIQPDQGVGAVKELVCQLLHQLRLAHAGGAHKDEAGRTAWRPERSARLRV